MTLRLADLPKDIPAAAIYEQMKAIDKKLKSLEAAKSKLTSEQLQLTRDNIDKTELLFRVKRAITSLEKAPAEDRRPIYSNLIKFAELYPTKIRLGVYAPAASAASATASNFSADSGSMRAGSCKVSTGAREHRLVEPKPLTLGEEYPIQWRRPNADLAELAKLRWINRWSVSRLAAHFERSPETIQMYMCHLRAGKIYNLNLPAPTLRKIEMALRCVFKGG